MNLFIRVVHVFYYCIVVLLCILLLSVELRREINFKRYLLGILNEERERELALGQDAI